MRGLTRLGVGFLVLAAATGAPAPAEACGGTFCDQAPPGQAPMPVDQTGENVLFVMQNGWVEAHIQIQYQGDPARFAWVIPLPAKPELSVGSQVLFTNLLNGTVPTFTTTSTFETCGDEGSSSSGFGCGASSDDSAAGGTYGPGAGGTGGKSNGPQVISRQAVGNFETLTLEPKDAKGMLDWLVANGYDADQADAEPILKDYIDRGYVFVALKLQPDAGVDEIHPLVVRYQGTEPCVPLKLTRIAAVEDMTVRTFFLGGERVVPTGGYKHVTMNGARLDWTQLGQNYNLAVARAVDSPAANGRAFITEYAGPSGVVNPSGISQSNWSGAALTARTRGRHRPAAGLEPAQLLLRVLVPVAAPAGVPAARPVPAAADGRRPRTVLLVPELLPGSRSQRLGPGRLWRGFRRVDRGARSARNQDPERQRISVADGHPHLPRGDDRRPDVPRVARTAARRLESALRHDHDSLRWHADDHAERRPQRGGHDRAC